MVEHLAEVAQINPAAACRATLEMLALICRGLVDALAAIFAARDFHHDTKRNRHVENPPSRPGGSVLEAGEV